MSMSTTTVTITYWHIAQCLRKSVIVGSSYRPSYDLEVLTMSEKEEKEEDAPHKVSCKIKHT